MTSIAQLQHLAGLAREKPCDETFAALVHAQDQFNADLAAEHQPAIFVCPLCGGVFIKNPDRTEDVKQQEFERNFSEEHRQGSRVSTCGSCYIDVLAWMKKKGITPS